MRNIVEETGSITECNQYQETGKEVLIAESIEYIDCDQIQAAAEEALGRVI